MNISRYTRRLCVVALSIVMTACATTQENRNKTNQYSIDSVYTNKSLVFSRLDVVDSDQGLLLKGKISLRSAHKTVPTGHIDVLVTDADGDALLDTAVRYSPSFSRRSSHNISKRSSAFTVALPKDLPAGAEIRVAYHRNPYQEITPSPPAHHENNSLL
jgi:hypothetical protein